MKFPVAHRHTSALGISGSLIGGASLFLTFRIAIELTGASVVGAWALIQSSMFLSRISDAGAGINITRMVAVYRTEHGGIPLAGFVIAGFVLGVIPVLGLGALLIAPVDWLLVSHFKTPLPASLIFDLVVLSFVAAVLSSLASLLLSTLEGAGWLFYRYLITIVSNLVLGASSYPLLSHFGPSGLGMVYIASSAVQVLGGAVILPMVVRPAHRTSVSNWRLLAELWRENLKTSGMALIRLTFEPWTKFLVASTAGVAAVAALDLAFRVTTQVRVAVQAATQPLLAIGARSDMQVVDQIHSHYTRASDLVIRVNVFLAGALVAGGPLIQFLGFGSLSAEFLRFFTILAVANAVNSLGVVGYYFAVSGGGTGRVLRIHVEMMLINLAFGAVGAFLIAPWAGVLAYAFAFFHGGVALARPWMDVSGITWRELARRELGWLLSAGLLAVTAFALTLWPGFGWLSGGHNTLLFIAGSTLIGFFLFATFALRNWRLIV